jgi:hypothetical protein
MSPSTQDTVYGLTVGIGFSLFVFCGIPAWVETPPHVRIAAVSPTFWPRIVSIFLALMGFLLAFGGMRRRSLSGLETTPCNAESAPRQRNITPLVTLSVFLAYYLLIDVLGMVLSSVLAMLVMARHYGERNWPVLAFVALALPLTLYAFFVWVAKVPLPLGLFA